MNFISKHCIAILLSAFSVLFLTACGENGDSSMSSSSSAASSDNSSHVVVYEEEIYANWPE